MTNKISAELTAEQLAEFKQDIEKIKAKYPWLISLTPEERNASNRIGARSYPFVSKVIEYDETHPEYMPTYVDRAELKKDFKLWGELNTMIRISELLTESISDTAIQAGNEAMEAALAYYASVRNAAKRNAAGAQTIYDNLKSRFQGRPAKKDDAKTKPEETKK